MPSTDGVRYARGAVFSMECLIGAHAFHIWFELEGCQVFTLVPVKNPALKGRQHRWWSQATRSTRGRTYGAPSTTTLLGSMPSTDGVRYARGMSLARTRSPRAPQPPCKRWLRQTPVLSRIGWRRLAKKHRGRSALSDDLGNLPHEAACHLDYVRQLGAPVHCSALPKSPDNVQSFVDRGPNQSGMVLVRYHSEAVKSSGVLT